MFLTATVLLFLTVHYSLFAFSLGRALLYEWSGNMGRAIADPSQNKVPDLSNISNQSHAMEDEASWLLSILQTKIKGF